MKTPTFTDRLAAAARKKQSVLIVGLDPQFKYMPKHLLEYYRSHYGQTFQAIGNLFAEFNRIIIDAVHASAIAIKPQMACYEKYGSWGVWALQETITYAKSKGLEVITDGKRGDGGDSADAYADGHIGEVDFWGKTPEVTEFTKRPSLIRSDALTIHAHIGDDCVGRFVKRVQEHGTGIFVVDKTSFTPNSRFEQIETKSGLKVWQELACLVDEWGRDTEGACGYRNVGAVLGATYPEDAPWMRKKLPNSWILIPGYGSQNATADNAVVCINEDGLGGGVNSSRAIIFAYLKGLFQRDAERFASAAQEAAEFSRRELNTALRKAGKWFC